MINSAHYVVTFHVLVAGVLDPKTGRTRQSYGLEKHIRQIGHTHVNAYVIRDEEIKVMNRQFKNKLVTNKQADEAMRLIRYMYEDRESARRLAEIIERYNADLIAKGVKLF